MRTNQLMRNLNIRVHSSDNRRIEVIADGLPFYSGCQIALDATLVSPLTCQGNPRLNSHIRDAAVLEEARRKKEQRTYADVANSGRCRFITAGVEIGGRWAPALVIFIARLAKSKTRSVPKPLQTAAKHWWRVRWTGMLSVATHVALAMSLVQDEFTDAPCHDGAEPPALSVIAE